MYTSSPQTFIFKYIFPVMFIGMGIFGYIMSSQQEETVYFSKGFLVALIWVSIFLVQMPFRLKRITVDEN
ncbi:MAG: hypothetical protein AAGK97_13310, partial [Bacteroidota bacterium]